MDFNDLSGMSQRELSQLRRKYAKRANQRLLRLERSSSPVTGEAYHAGAYDIALEYLREIGREKRFSESINYTKTIDEETGETAYDIYRLKREILELDTFLHSKTSTVSGNKAAEKKRIEIFTSEKYGLSRETVASKEFYDFLQSEAYDYFLKNSFTSEQLMDVYDIYRNTHADDRAVRRGIEAYKKHLKEINADATDGKAKDASLKEMVDYINKAAFGDDTSKYVTARDVLRISGD